MNIENENFIINKIVWKAFTSENYVVLKVNYSFSSVGVFFNNTWITVHKGKFLP